MNEQNELSELVVKSRNGNRDAQELLVRAVQDQVFFHCRKTLKNDDDAMDAAQDILLSMLKNLKNLREPAAFKGWLAKITCRVCWKHMDRKSRDRAVLAEIGQDFNFENFEDTDAQSVPDQILDTEETRRIVRELVDELPPEQCMCVLLYYYDEMSVRDIAAALSVSEGTVKSRLYYARQNIKKNLEKYADVPFYSPVPFLRWFLRREAAGGLTAAAAKSLTKSVMAAAAVSVPKGAAAAAVGIILAGVIGAGALPGLIAPETNQPSKTPDIAPQAAAETFEPVQPVHPVEPVKTAEPAQRPDAPAPARIERLSAVQPAPAPVSLPVISVRRETPEIPQIPDIPEIPDMPETVLTVADRNPETVPPISVPEPDEIAPPDVFARPAEPETAPGPSTSTPVSSEPSEPSEPSDPSGSYQPPYSIYEPSDPPVNPITPEIPVEPEITVISQEVENYGSHSGRGFNDLFSAKWDGDLPENLVFSSSDPSIIAVNGEGRYSTLSPGKAVLTAEDPDNPGVKYELSIEVQDRMEWDYTLDDVSVEAGHRAVGHFSSYGMYADLETIKTVWTSGDESIVTVTPVPNPMACWLDGIAPGETDVSGLVFFTADTVAGELEMQEEVSFHVTVAAPEPEPVPEPVPEPEPDSADSAVDVQEDPADDSMICDDAIAPSDAAVTA